MINEQRHWILTCDNLRTAQATRFRRDANKHYQQTPVDLAIVHPTLSGETGD